MRVLIAGGGTGGHLFPGIAIAEEVMARPGGAVLFVGTARGLETKLVPAAGFPLELLDVSGLNRVGAGKMLKGLLRLPKAFFASRAVLRRFKPDLVLGVGGYASGPLVLAAALSGYPTAIQEQNSRPGFTNRVLGVFARRVFVAFDDARGFFGAAKTRLLGNPVRRTFTDGVTTAAASSGYVLILGGSQGARAVNDLVADAAAGLGKQGQLPHVVHQTGAGDEARTRARYKDLGLDVDGGAAVTIRPFIDDMPAVLAGAALVVGRAGALTLAELAMTGRPAILIPLPTAADDHQTSNAAEFERAGAAVVASQASTTPESLAQLIAALMNDPARRAAMSKAMAALGRPAATRDIVDELATLVKTH
ncbi:MAG TPA: undecaprenyldiphospho-muramoylpentapeptide beta-N-acetylglucosaminyltransferase [Polyangia bacterium]|nr:undecaprenyldiphospho-muramoylpentapeptide beta-N-acetylglucosaminyltransferase [Polyangia bacterium]